MITDIYEEYAKCLMSPKYVIETYLKVYSLVASDYIPFKLLNNQNDVIDAYEDENSNRNIIKKCRQAGLSSVTEAYLSVKAAFAKSKHPEMIIIVSNNLTNSQHNLKRVKEYLLQLPRWVWGLEYIDDKDKVIFSVDTKTKLVLPNGSQIMVTSTRPDALKGYTPTYLVFDNAAFIESGYELYYNIQHTLMFNTNVMMLSTPNGTDNFFHNTYVDATCGRNSFNILDLNWWNDERKNKDLKWILKKNGIVYSTVTDVLPKNQHRLMLSGYKPTNRWYEQMIKDLSNLIGVRQEIDAEFVV